MLSHQEIGQGEPLVLVHGWAHQGDIFSPLAAHLPGYRLLMPDLPGHGRSAAAESEGLHGWTDALERWLKATVDQPCHLLGWSLGGTLLLNLLSSKSPQVSAKSLTLMSATPRFVEGPDWPGMSEKQLRLLKSGLRRRPNEALEAFDGWLTATAESASVGTTKGGDLPSLLDGLEILQRTDLVDRLPQITVPVLQIHGQQDRVVPLAAAEQVSQVLNARIRWLPTGHLPFYEQPVDVARALLGFLDG